MRDLVEKIVMNLVDDESAVDVKQVVGEQTTILEVKVAPEDVGKIIGKMGNTAKAIRTLMKATSKKHGHKFNFEILSDR